MNRQAPIYSERNECQDCYKCVRQCPVKAIQIVDGSATVVSSRCLFCGRCVTVCPAGAKHVRNDVVAAQGLLRQRARVIVSLAPSFVSEFQGASAGQLIAACKRLGFWGVSETALGAQDVSARIAGLLGSTDQRVLLSTACPVAVEFVRKYHPELANALTPVVSPVLAHCRQLRERYGPEIGIVFVGPCIAKKLEADRHADLLDAALTFEDLHAWFEAEGVDPGAIEAHASQAFIPEAAADGALYPIEGGMNLTLKAAAERTGTRLATVSGLGAMDLALRGLAEPANGSRVLVELLACEGGCVNGPKSRRRSTLSSRMDVLDYVGGDGARAPGRPSVAVDARFEAEPVAAPVYSETQIEDTLRRLGKVRPEDELNCGGCGYDTCRQMARALLAGEAEERMCVSYMRRLAQKKANALIRTIPFGVVIVDETLAVVDCNERFVRLLGDDLAEVYANVPGLGGARVDRLLPFADRFRQVLRTGRDLPDHTEHVNDRLLRVTVFSIETHRVAGAILQDVTAVESRREQVVAKARTVIRNTLTTVQDIAFRLGKNAADSEVILNSIIEGFGEPDEAPAAGGRDDG